MHHVQERRISGLSLKPHTIFKIYSPFSENAIFEKLLRNSNFLSAFQSGANLVKDSFSPISAFYCPHPAQKKKKKKKKKIKKEKKKKKKKHLGANCVQTFHLGRYIVGFWSEISFYPSK